MSDVATVRKAGAKFARAQAARDRARDELYAEIRAAHAAGVAPKDLIEASRLSRQGVFNVLDKADNAQPPAADERPEIVSYPETGAAS